MTTDMDPEESGRVLTEMFEKTYRDGVSDERRRIADEVERLADRTEQKKMGILGPDGYAGASAIVTHLRGFLRGSG
jgi:hypothetical protein